MLQGILFGNPSVLSHATGRAWAAAQESNQHVQVYKCLCVVYFRILQHHQCYQN